MLRTLGLITTPAAAWLPYMSRCEVTMSSTVVGSVGLYTFWNRPVSEKPGLSAGPPPMKPAGAETSIPRWPIRSCVVRQATEVVGAAYDPHQVFSRFPTVGVNFRPPRWLPSGASVGARSMVGMIALGLKPRTILSSAP